MSDQHSLGDCWPKIRNSWGELVGMLNFGHPVAPLGSVAPPQSEFFIINSRTRIRVIHMGHEKGALPGVIVEQASKRNSLTEEYWFSKWNKPLRVGICSCSFRRSFRLSLVKNGNRHSGKERQSVTSFDAFQTKIVNIETFVERIVQETTLEAYNEYYMLIQPTNGIVNVGCQKVNYEDIVLKKTQLSDSSCLCYHNKYSQKKPFVILFHGIGTSADIWWSVMNCLINKDYEVIAPDLLGHGYSSTPNNANAYTFHNLFIHAITIFDHYMAADNERKCILIGHSYGCSLVTALYRHRPSQISQLILISGGGPTPLAAPVMDYGISPFGCVQTLIKPLLFCGMKRSFIFSSHGKHFEICDPNTAIPPHIIKYLIMGQDWPEGDAAFHRRILVPTLLVHGLQDKLITLVQQCEMERTIPRAFLELIPNAGHMSMLETPEHLNHMILCFIECWNL